MKQVLQNKNFFLLWTGRLISQVGDKLYGIALAWWVLQKTDSPVAMGLLMATSILPGLIIAPLAGTLIDRWNRRPVLITADIFRGIFVGAVACLSFIDKLELWHVFVVATVISLGAAFYDPTVQAVIPQIVPKEELPQANAFNQLISGISMVLGPVSGAVAVSFLGFTTVFCINGLSYLISALCGGLMRIPMLITPAIKKAAWKDMKAGIKFLIKRKRIVIIIGVIGIAHFFFGGLMVSLPFLVKRLAGNGVQNLGYLETMIGVGLILGSIGVSLERKGDLRDEHLFYFMIGLGLCLLLIGGFQWTVIEMLMPYLILLILIGLVIAKASVYWQSLLQLNTPGEMAGRIFSISTMMGNISLPLAFGIIGLLLKFSSIMLLMSFSGITLIIMSILLFVGYRKVL